MTQPVSSAPTALILGASGALGGAIAQALATKGYALALHARTHPERCSAVKGAGIFRADFREPAQIETLVKEVLKTFPRLDAVIWAAGIAHEALVVNLKEEDAREVLAVNLTAPVLLAKALARQMIKQKSGSWIFLSSHAALSGRVGGTAYAMAQSGLLALMKSLAREWGASGIRVNAVLPPFVPESGLGRAASSEFAEQIRRRNVLKAPAGQSPAPPIEDLAQFVLGLCKNQSASGQVFVTDGRVL